MKDLAAFTAKGLPVPHGKGVPGNLCIFSQIVTFFNFTSGSQP